MENPEGDIWGLFKSNECQKEEDFVVGSLSKERFKLLMAVAANNHFKLASVDIRAVFHLGQDVRQRNLQEATRRYP